MLEASLLRYHLLFLFSIRPLLGYYSGGADPGFDEGGSAKRPPKVVAPRGVRGHAPPKNF